MQVCSKCGFENVDNIKKCANCGIDLQWARVNLGKFKGTPSDTARLHAQGTTKAQEEASGEQPQYPALGIVGTIYGLTGWLVLVGGALFGMLVAYTTYNTTGNLLIALLSFVGLPLSGAIIALPMLATKDVIAWMLDIALDLRESNESLNDLVEVQGKLTSSAQSNMQYNASSQQTPASRLNNLKELLKTGLITEEEYKHKRDDVLHKI